MKKKDVLCTGKAKSVYHTDDDKKLILHFRNDTSAFDGEKIEKLARKGEVNNKFNAFIMQKLEEAGIPTHFEELISDEESLVKKLDMFPIECVVRNIAAGSLCKRLGVEEGLEVSPPIFEFFLKDDALHDPMINEYHIQSFGWAKPEDVTAMQELTFKVNKVLKKLFADCGLLLVDYKLEFGRFGDQIVLGDEFTPDGCRLWDAETRKKLDKDRFRQGLGGVVEAYEEVASRLGVNLG
jgi:phosphoribosylaminoimidazole-succinocarboxamide synthase